MNHTDPRPHVHSRTVLRSLLEMVLGVPALRNCDLDDPQSQDVFRRILRTKPFLRRLYADYYDRFLHEYEALRPLSGSCVELGSGAGFLQELIPELITSDVFPHPSVNRVIQAETLGFPERSVKAIFMLNVLHHVKDPAAFFTSADRCLVPGGRVIMIEPYRSWWSKLFYGILHHEPYDETAAQWSISGHGRLHDANIAGPWIIFWRDRARFESSWPSLKIRSIELHTVFAYLLSGGFAFRALLPAVTYPLVRTIDRWLAQLTRIFPIFQTVILEKR